MARVSPLLTHAYTAYPASSRSNVKFGTSAGTDTTLSVPNIIKTAFANRDIFLSDGQIEHIMPQIRPLLRRLRKDPYSSTLHTLYINLQQRLPEEYRTTPLEIVKAIVTEIEQQTKPHSWTYYFQSVMDLIYNEQFRSDMRKVG